MPGPFDFGIDDPATDSVTAAQILARRFPALANTAAPTLPPQPAQPAAQAPDIAAPSAFQNKYNLPWLPGYNPNPSQPQLARPPLTSPNGELLPGTTKGQKLGVLLKAGSSGALAGRAAQEQMIAASGGRRSGGI